MISQIKNKKGMMENHDQNRAVSRAKRTGKSGCQAKLAAPGARLPMGSSSGACTGLVGLLCFAQTLLVKYTAGI